MAVKFNFDQVDSTNGDAWVEFTCHFCKKYVTIQFLKLQPIINDEYMYSYSL